MVPSTISFTGAAAAYDRARDALSRGGGLCDRDAAPGPASPPSCATRSATPSPAGQASEPLSLAAVADQADLTQVVTAVAEAETMLNTVVAVRDRVIEAYKDIMRMPI